LVKVILEKKMKVSLMNEGIASFKPDLRISLAWVIVFMGAAGGVLSVTAQCSLS
jgi:hypothetical protein